MSQSQPFLAAVHAVRRSAKCPPPVLLLATPLLPYIYKPLLTLERITCSDAKEDSQHCRKLI